MKALIFIALLAIASCSDDSDTPGTLIGSWDLAETNITSSSSSCCVPGGVLTIKNNFNDSITLTSTEWIGGSCGSRNSKTALLAPDVDGSDSWNEFSQGSGVFQFNTTNGDEFAIVMDFSDGNELLAMAANDDSDCIAIYLKSNPNFDTGDTPGTVIGSWNSANTTANSSSSCCLPDGVMTIINNYNDTVTLTSTSWVGGLCPSSNIELQVPINGSESWNEISNNNASIGFKVGDEIVYASMLFFNGPDFLSLIANEDVDCISVFLKSVPGPQAANLLATAGACLIALATALLI